MTTTPLPTVPTDTMVDAAAQLLWDHVAVTQGWGLDWETAKRDQPAMTAACADDARKYVAAALFAHAEEQASQPDPDEIVGA
jgi:hypothetical protein